MEFESTEKLQMVYETLKNIETAITRLQERTVQIHTVDNFLLSPFGMEKLDAACMVIIALGEAVIHSRVGSVVYSEETILLTSDTYITDPLI